MAEVVAMCVVMMGECLIEVVVTICMVMMVGVFYGGGCSCVYGHDGVSV